jgi:hypothetical protein
MDKYPPNKDCVAMEFFSA